MVNQDRPDVMEFYRDYSWHDYMTTWHDNLIEYGVNPQAVCKTIVLAETRPWPPMQTAWWQLDHLDDAGAAVLHYLKAGAWDDDRYDLGWLSKGELETAVALHATQNRIDTMCALLTLASGFHHTSGRNRRYDEWVAHPVILRRLEDECREKLKDAGIIAPWRHYHASVLPAGMSMTGVRATQAVGYAAIMAAEHAMNLTRFAPVRFVNPPAGE